MDQAWSVTILIPNANMEEDVKKQFHVHECEEFFRNATTRHCCWVSYSEWKTGVFEWMRSLSHALYPSGSLGEFSNDAKSVNGTTITIQFVS